MPDEDARYLKIVVDPIRVCAHYRPKFGQGAGGDGLTLAQFQKLYQSDSFYNWFGLDNPLNVCRAQSGRWNDERLSSNWDWLREAFSDNHSGRI
jgi:hypothetical protein